MAFRILELVDFEKTGVEYVPLHAGIKDVSNVLSTDMKNKLWTVIDKGDTVAEHPERDDRIVVYRRRPVPPFGS